ncbi:MAG: class IV adenylate cyclase [Bacteroidales bacterium]|nr:class IV adenylate cyclase [Bacteroidales bacterium]
MALNLELKILVESYNKMLEKIRKSDAAYVKTIFQKDIYYKVKKGLLKLRVEDGSFTLIKYLRDEKGKRWSNYQLLKLDGENPEKYLGGLFEIDTVVQKKRELYMYKNTRIHLDTVKGLGKFLELESVVVKNKKTSEKEFDDVVNFLNLDLSNQIKASYKNLIEQKKFSNRKSK